jgi:hemoglobin-like flavoprotein
VIVDHDKEVIKAIGNIVNYLRNTHAVTALTVETVSKHYSKGVRPNQYRVRYSND